MPHKETITCPKCHTQYQADACPRCGLILNKWRGHAAREAAPPPPQLEATWKNVLENWDKPAAHALFVERCLVAGAADYAAKKYRERGDDPVARGQLEALTARMIQRMTTGTKRTQSRTSRRALRALIVVLLAVAALGILCFIAS